MYIEHTPSKRQSHLATCMCLELGRLEGYMHVHVHVLYLSHVICDVQVHVDSDDEFDQVLSQVGVLMDDGKVKRSIQN